MIESVTRGVVVDRVSAMSNGLDELDALVVHAAHAGERDGEVLVATREYTGEVAVRVAVAVGLRPDDEVGLVRVLDKHSVQALCVYYVLRY